VTNTYKILVIKYEVKKELGIPVHWCEHSDVLSQSIKVGKFLDNPSQQLLRKDSLHDVTLDCITSQCPDVFFQISSILQCSLSTLHCLHIMTE
jgi:hypothetical protein